MALEIYILQIKYSYTQFLWASKCISLFCKSISFNKKKVTKKNICIVLKIHCICKIYVLREGVETGLFRKQRRMVFLNTSEYLLALTHIFKTFHIEKCINENKSRY